LVAAFWRFAAPSPGLTFRRRTWAAGHVRLCGLPCQRVLEFRQLKLDPPGIELIVAELFPPD
jgi:hypothetical protein